MKILIAPDSFKESVSAADAANAIQQGLAHSQLNGQYRCLPLADGGEGTVDALTNALNGEIKTTQVRDPLGRLVTSHWGKVNDTAVIEMASASGLELLSEQERNPLITDSFGTGQLILDALDHGVSKIILGLGGSATNDGGAGLMRALGAKLYDQYGNDIAPGGGSLAQLKSIDLQSVDRRLANVRFSLACDVSNPLCGSNGASAIFGPQKGADKAMVELLDQNLKHFASVLQPYCDIDLLTVAGMGAAGGLSLGLELITKVERGSGFDLISNAVELEKHIQWADLVITGEGKTDNQSLAGKACFGVANLAKSLNTPVLLISGSLGKDYQQLYQHGVVAAFSATLGPTTLQNAIKNARQNLQQTALAIGNLLTLR
ncbi:glycerate kinase [Thalassotalea litorea]|uniref:Glycerate kinase n=1 Tax=Thalassotalea litorea TaxID=2020715 RepID=A0A5R9IP21_9GAMM|nr:glycerate kinase [Thalassotalea litorea]TLU65807.1 glycerate kinase [Thalassotalea litorea]